ncbi:hypothetical protein PAXRUDRAFT_181131 [Paxillus rubicundulus Ve08.2h10]|uniref:Uncharacterized protein n=1 Tax=Paxillus rubicundulus Ve08.2h10 TaxID=930991 RepID=A0A0D0C980_9AGAM|nr:hypothetical protein PAXRUDRAFT_181131 [Paxillus rubicundulus Ve08.2h10]
MERYKPLVNQDLKVTTAISDPNWSVHCMENLAWFWFMDIPRDAQESDWMSECRLYICCGRFRLMQVLSLPRKLAEEVELIKSEVQWTVNFFDSKFRQWEKLGTQS